MAQASIFTLDAQRGGVPRLARVVYDLLGAAGHTPVLVSRATEEMPSASRVQALRYMLTTPPVRPRVRDGLESISVVAYPVAPRFQYHMTRLARAAVRAPIAAVVSGSSHAGLARALARRPYVLWVATIYGDEVRGRADAGDQWAARLLQSRDWPALEAQERLVCERATVVLAASSHTRERIAARWPSVGDRLREVLNPIDTDRFRPNGEEEDPPYLLLTARIQDRRKNVDMLLRALARVRAEHPRVRLVVAGDEPTPEITALVSRFGLEHATSFPGYVSAAALVALYQRAAIFVLASRQEGLGISVQEAMACGVPVISTRSGGPECLVEDGVTGLLVANDDENALARAIGELLQRPDRRRKMGKAARERALRLFASQHIEAKLRQAFEDAFGSTFSRPPAAKSEKGSEKTWGR